MASFVSGQSRLTACARMCAPVWRYAQRPFSSSQVRSFSSQSSLIGRNASARSPLISQQSVAFLRPFEIAPAMSSAQRPFSNSRFEPSGNVMIIGIPPLLFSKNKTPLGYEGRQKRGSTLFGALVRCNGRSRFDPPAVFTRYFARHSHPLPLAFRSRYALLLPNSPQR